MTALGPKQTSKTRSRMSAFEGKADITRGAQVRTSALRTSLRPSVKRCNGKTLIRSAALTTVPVGAVKRFAAALNGRLQIYLVMNLKRPGLAPKEDRSARPALLVAKL